MNRNELLKLFGNEPLFGERVALSPLTSDKVDLLLNHMLGTLNAPENIKTSYEKKNAKKHLKTNTTLYFLFILKPMILLDILNLKNLDGTPEIGIDLAEKHQGKGYGFETCQSTYKQTIRKNRLRIYRQQRIQI